MTRYKQVLLFVVLAFLLLEATFTDVLSVFGVRPDLILLMVVYAGLESSLGGAMKAGIVGGAVHDLFSDAPLGLNIFCAVLVGYCVAWSALRLMLDDAVKRMGVVFVASLCYGLVKFVLMKWAKPAVQFPDLFLENILPIAFYNTLLSPVVMALVSRAISPLRRAEA